MGTTRINIAGRSVHLHIEKADALEFPSDVLIAKYAQGFYGLDRAIADALPQDIPSLSLEMPKSGDFRLFDTKSRLAAERVLFIGVPPLRQFRYRDIREFARSALGVLAQNAPSTRRISVTVHGPGFGLDEMECFDALVAGILDGLSAGTFPEMLSDVAIIEKAERRADAFNRALDNLIRDRMLEINFGGAVALKLNPAASERIRAAGYASDTKPLVFVAMPFREDMMDHYDYGILRATQRAGFLCERADQAHFTGDILDWIKHRIDACQLLVADISFGNPNVFLEVGYAWGRNKPTILLKRAEEQLPFDAQSQRCLIYKRIKDIEDKLYEELTHL